MTILFLIFVIVSVALIPFAWIVGCVDKLNADSTHYSQTDKICNYLFIPFGAIILPLDILADMSYFWKNSFRQGLK
jgi:hypothetical protein